VTFGLAIEIPIRNRTAKANLAGARIQGEQLSAQARALEQTIEVDVRNAAQAVEITRRQILAARAERERELRFSWLANKSATGPASRPLFWSFSFRINWSTRARPRYAPKRITIRRSRICSAPPRARCALIM
jgi:hypothetical protein